MKNKTLPTTNTTTTNTQATYSWSTNPSSLTWTQIQHMSLDEQAAALAAIGFGDAGSASIEAIIESTNKWLAGLARLGEKHAYSILVVARALFIHERAILAGESED